MCGLSGDTKDMGGGSQEKNGSLRRRVWSWTKQNILGAGDDEGNENTLQSSNTASDEPLKEHDSNPGLARSSRGWRGHGLHFQVSIDYHPLPLEHIKGL